MSDIKESAVIVKGVYKSFRLPHEQHSGLKQLLVNRLKGKKGYETQRVLKDISFEVMKGEFFGIVGRNGSGKSTLLKLLAGIYVPDKGVIQINGSLTPFIELGVGFNPELTGRENVFLNGALLGFSRAEMDVMYQSIVDFAEIEKFMDQKLKNYSSGMQVRLAFSIAVRANSDILVLDEVLAVGDAAFQQKCFEYFDDLKAKKRTIILVTHDMSAVKQFCDRALLIKDGRIEAIGEPSEIAHGYEHENYASEDGSSDNNKDKISVVLRKNADKRSKIFNYGQDIFVDIKWDSGDKKVGIVGVAVYKGGEAVFATNTIDQNVSYDNNQLTLRLSPKLGAGRYKIAAAIFGDKRTNVIDVSRQQPLIIVNQPEAGFHEEEWQGVVYVENEWINK